MRLSEIGLLLIAAAAVAGLFLVVTAQRQYLDRTDEGNERPDPVSLLERDLAGINLAPGFREVPAAPPDTVVRSMTPGGSVSERQANLHITRALEANGFDHIVTYRVEKGLVFLCHTPEGWPFRLYLDVTEN